MVGLLQSGHAVSAAASGVCGAPLVGAGRWACGRLAPVGHGCGNPVCPLYASPHRRSAELDLGAATRAWEPAERVRACVAGSAYPETRPRVRVSLRASPVTAVRGRTRPPCSVRCGTACQSALGTVLGSKMREHGHTRFWPCALWSGRSWTQGATWRAPVVPARVCGVGAGAPVYMTLGSLS